MRERTLELEIFASAKITQVTIANQQWHDNFISIVINFFIPGVIAQLFIRKN